MSQDINNEKLQRKHDQERKQFIQDFNTYKQRAEERETKLNAEYQQKYDIMKTNVDKMHEKFKEKMKLFETTNQRLNLEEAKKSSKSGLEEMMKKKHEKERSIIKETFQSDLSKQAVIVRDDITNKLKQQYERELGEIYHPLWGIPPLINARQ